MSVTAGLRVSELVGLRLDDVVFTAPYVDLRVRGKGRKERILTLWKVVADSVRAWLAVRGEAPVPELFLNARGREMTRAGFAHLLRQHAITAREVSVAPRQADLTSCASTHLRPERLAGDRGIFARSRSGSATKAPRPPRTTCGST